MELIVYFSFMRTMKYEASAICKILDLNEKGASVREICEVWEIKKSAFFEMKKKFSGMNESQVTKMIELEGENRRLSHELNKSNKLILAAKDDFLKKL